MLLSQHVSWRTIAFKMTEQVERRISLKFCIKLEHSSMETFQMIQKASAMVNWWLGASSKQHIHLCIMSRAEFYGGTSNHTGDSAPLQPRFGTLWLLKTKIIFEREEISDHWCNSENMTGQLMAIGSVWGPKMPTLEGTEVSLPCVCRACIFLNKCL